MDESADFRHFARSGDAAAFTRLVRRWEARLYRLAYRVTGDPGSAEDVLQTVLVRVLERRGDLGVVRTFDSWIQRATVNESINVLRQTRRREARNGEAARRFEGVRGVDNEPIDALVRDEDRGRLERALERIDPDGRALLSLRFDEDLTYQSISDVLERPLSTVKSQIERAIRKLRIALERMDTRGTIP